MKSDIEKQQITQEPVWNTVVSLIQNQSQLVQHIAFKQFKLAYKLEKQEIVRRLGALGSNSQLSKSSLETDLAAIQAKQANFEKVAQQDLSALKKLAKENKDNPRSSLILEISQKNMNDLRSYATYHKPNIQTLEQRIANIPVNAAVQELTPSPDQQAGSTQR